MDCPEGRWGKPDDKLTAKDLFALGLLGIKPVEVVE